jgi:hypothetical protein
MDYNAYVGAHVFTLDGEELGTVKEIRHDLFKVDAPMRPDYWLRCDCINAGMAGSERLTVAFTKEELRDRTVKEPAA